MSARENAYTYLRQAIVSGELPGGRRVVEEQLADDLGMSRTPIREALQRLTSEGLIVRLRRGHLEVVDIGPAEREEIHLLRVAVDQVVAKLLTHKVDQVDWNSLYTYLEPLEAAYTTMGIKSSEYAVAHLDLHLAINHAAFSGLARTLTLGSTLYAPTDDYVQQGGYEPVEQHRALLDSLASGDLTRATSAMATHALRGHRDDVLGHRPPGQVRTFS